MWWKGRWCDDDVGHNELEYSSLQDVGDISGRLRREAWRPNGWDNICAGVVLWLKYVHGRDPRSFDLVSWLTYPRKLIVRMFAAAGVEWHVTDGSEDERRHDKNTNQKYHTRTSWDDVRLRSLPDVSGESVSSREDCDEFKSESTDLRSLYGCRRFYTDCSSSWDGGFERRDLDDWQRWVRYRSSLQKMMSRVLTKNSKRHCHRQWRRRRRYRNAQKKKASRSYFQLSKTVHVRTWHPADPFF